MTTETTKPPVVPPSETDPILPVREAEAKLRATAIEQGTVCRSTFHNLLETGSQLWETDEEFDRFLGFLREIRSAKG